MYHIIGEKINASQNLIMMEENLDITNIITPVKINNLQRLLEETNYDRDKTQYLVEGFKNGFDIGYRGPDNIKQKSQNLKFTIGDEVELWNKVMKEVKEKRYAGPFKEIPFEHYIQSPIGLVPKDGGKKTRLIFHLSHPRDQEKGISVNGATPEEMKKVKYKEFDDAIRLCIIEGIGCAVAKSDLSAAFRHLPIKPEHWKFLVMKAKNPVDQQWYYFIDKCLPFGAAISCAHFQAFSNALAHIVREKTGKDNVNYLDDFFFAQLLRYACNLQVEIFLSICTEINFPVSLEKTFWATTSLTFLGLLIDTVNQLICVPVEKIEMAKNIIIKTLNRKPRKMKLKELQSLTGFLNFLCKAVVPGRAFTRRLYNFTESVNVTSPNHHVQITGEMRLDLEMWLEFLDHPSIFNRKFIDLKKELNSEEVDFYTDASANKNLGCGGISGTDWYILQWDASFMKKHTPSINYLELYAVTVAVLMWLRKFADRRITIFCDNMSVVHMLNTNSSKCVNCMYLIRVIVLHCLKHNVKLAAKHVEGKMNTFSDCLSRMKYKQFWQHARKMNRDFKNKPEQIPQIIWPMGKIWTITDNEKKMNALKNKVQST